MAFPPLGNSDHVVVSVSIEKLKTGCPVSLAYDNGLRDHLRDVPWEDIFKLGASTAASEFCEWVQVGIDVYIPHRKYQVKSHSSPWFSAACAAAIVQSLFSFVNRINLLNLESSDRLVIVAKGFLKLPNLHMLLKQKSPTSQIGSREN